MGVLFVNSLRDYVGERFGEEDLRALPLELPVIGDPLGLYALVDAASTRAGVERARFLEEFGEFFVSALAKQYGGLVQPSWTTLDLIEHVERALLGATKPDVFDTTPLFTCVRLHDRAVSLKSRVPRGFCALARGVIRGFATCRDEEVRIEDAACMLHGDAACELIVRRV